MVYNILLKHLEQFEMNLTKIKYVTNDFVTFLNDLKCFENDIINEKELLSPKKSRISNLSPFVTNPILALHPN